MIEVKGLYKSFDDKTVLSDINASFENGKTNLIIGQSGSGKTVLMKCIVGLLTPEKGEVLYDGRNLVMMGKKEKKMLRKEMGMIFQSAISTFFGSLIPSTRPIRFVRRMQCVSVTIAGFLKTSPMIRFALFLPTPGSFKIASKSHGTLPSYSSRSIFMHALISRALLFPRPHGLTIASISSGVASARASTSGYFA